MAVRALPVDQRIIDIDSRRFASVDKALVELVTNADDSYSRLEEEGVDVSGIIDIGYQRHLQGAVLTVADRAEGMGFERLRAVLSYGGAHSRLSRGEAGGRGYFGRGMKQAVYGLGHGWVESIRDGRYSRVDLFRSEDGGYVFDDWDTDFPASRADHLEVGVPYGSDGTKVTVVVDNPDVVLPYTRTLLTGLAHNIYLRDVLARRTVRFVGAVDEARPAGEPVRITYDEPVSEVLIGPEAPGSFTYGGWTYEFTLTLRRAHSTELVLKGDARTNGLLVVAGTAVLDCQFFRFENQLGTEYLFGTVSCPALAARLAEGYPVISDEREGLNPKDPFVATFAEAVSEMVAPSVQSERLRLSHVETASTSRRTQALVDRVLRRMSDAAVDDLGIVLPPGPGSGTYGPYPTGRPAALRFSTPFYYRPVGRSFHVTLYADRSQIQDTDEVTVAYDLPDGLTVDPRSPTLTGADLPDGRLIWTVTGTTAGEHGRIRVSCGRWRATCEVVISERASRHRRGRDGHRGGQAIPATTTVGDAPLQATPAGTAPEEAPAPGPPPPPDGRQLTTVPAAVPGERPRRPRVWDQDNSTDMFVGYELRNLGNDMVRSVYSPQDRLILINTEAPTVRLYIDGRGHFRDGARLLLAELLLDAIAGELARRQVDRQHQRGDMAAYREAKQAFVRRYGLEIHRIMMGE